MGQGFEGLGYSKDGNAAVGLTSIFDRGAVFLVMPLPVL